MMIFLVDQEGTECAGLPEVREQALATAGAILRDFAPKFPSGLEWTVHVTDEQTTTLFKLRFSLEELASQAPQKLTVVGVA